MILEKQLRGSVCLVQDLTLANVTTSLKVYKQENGQAFCGMVTVVETVAVIYTVIYTFVFLT